jgi:hypothetical protein
MRTFAAFIILGFCLASSTVTVAQDQTQADRERLTLAEKMADTFVERFRQTMNFGPLWKEFRAEQFGCRLIKSDLITNVSDEEKVKIGIPLLERAYIAFMNYFYLKGAHDLSLPQTNSDATEEQITPKEILKAENSSVYARTNGKSPHTSKEIEEYIIELNRLARLYRKYMPRNVMRSAAWRAHYKYLTSRGGVTHLGVDSGHPDFCIPENTKYYIVDKGLFYFYIVEEKGKMKVAELAVDD